MSTATTQSRLNAAVDAIQHGDTEEAHRILVELLEDSPDDAEVWFVLSGAVDDHQTMAHCLRNALALDPEHVGARQMMAQLAQQLAIPPLTIMQVGAHSAAISQRCPYCSGAFQTREEVVSCPRCNASHHYECWAENGHACAGALCEGFSLGEIYANPLPVQPPAVAPKPIVIRKEDVPERGKVTRKEQEQSFQRRLLLMALLAEEGQLSPEMASTLPSVDEILDQVQRDRAVQGPAVRYDNRAHPATTTASQPGEAPRVITGPMPVWPQQIARADANAGSFVAVCNNCGRVFDQRRPNFCPVCGAKQ